MKSITDNNDYSITITPSLFSTKRKVVIDKYYKHMASKQQFLPEK